MANSASIGFGDTGFQGTITPVTPVVDPVVDKSGEGLAAGLAKGVGDLNDIFNTYDQAKNSLLSSSASKNNKITGSLAASLTQDINLLADGVDQGALDRSGAMTRLRAKVNSYMADNPGQESNIQEFVNKSLGATGLAPELAEDTPKEKADKIEAQAAYQAGWALDPNTPDKDVLDNYRRHKADLQKVVDLGTQIDLITKTGGVVDAQLKVKATVALHSAIDSGLPWVQGTIDTGFKQLQGVTDPTQRAAIIADVESKITTQTAVIDNMTTAADGAIDTSHLTAGYKELLDNFKAVANGTEVQAQYDNQSKLVQAKLGAMINMDPELATALAVDKLTNSTSPAALEFITAGTTRLLSKLKASGGYNDTVAPGEVPPQTADIVGNEPDIADTFALLTDQLKTLNSGGTVDPKTEAEANAKISGAFKSVARHSAAGMDPRELNSFIQWMADPNTGAWIEQHMKGATPQLAADAMKAVQDNYQNVGVDLINERWGAATVSWGPNAGRPGAPTADMSKAIVPTWNGSGIEFTVAPEFKNNAVVVNQAKKLTADISAPLNNMVRAQAHMMGTRDYTKVYNEGFAKRLWVAGEDVPGSITDFIPPKASETASKVNAYLDKVSTQESGGNPDAQSTTSSASGSFGIIDSTYNSYAKKLGLTGDKNDPANQKAVATAITKDNDNTLEANNLPVTDANRYALHFLGPQDGPEVLSADSNSLISDYVSPKVIGANAFLAGMTVGQFKSWAKKVVK